MENRRDQKIVEKLKEKYHPAAILLHGSRAVGKERKHSDWDIIMIFDKKIPKEGYREEINGEDVEWKAFTIPAKEKSITEIFDVYLQFAKVLWEKDEIGSNLLKMATAEYAKGPKQYTEDEIRREKQFFSHKIQGLIDDQDTQYLFFRHLCVLRTLAIRLWFELLNKRFSQPLYLAMPLIKKEDLRFYRNLVSFTAFETSPTKKIKNAKSMFVRIFGNL
ncbi:MAG: nucleotidyltransferase domain-containing protein [Patescibacteria group bacterium]